MCFVMVAVFADLTMPQTHPAGIAAASGMRGNGFAREELVMNRSIGRQP